MCFLADDGTTRADLIPLCALIACANLPWFLLANAAEAFRWMRSRLVRAGSLCTPPRRRVRRRLAGIARAQRCLDCCSSSPVGCLPSLASGIRPPRLPRDGDDPERPSHSRRDCSSRVWRGYGLYSRSSRRVARHPGDRPARGRSCRWRVSGSSSIPDSVQPHSRSAHGNGGHERAVAAARRSESVVISTDRPDES